MKYIAQDDGTMIASDLVGSDDVYSVKLDVIKLTYVIVGSKKRAATGKADSKASLLKKVKDDLKRLNVKFSDEVRKRPYRKKEDVNDSSHDALSDDFLVNSLWDKP